MIYALLLLLFSACLFGIFEDRLGNFKWIVYILLGFVLFFLTAFRPIGIDNDSRDYVNYFYNYDNPIFESNVEFSFLWISKIFYNIFHNPRSVFILYALLGITIKWVAFRKLTPMVFLAVVIYLGNYFILHEFTQIRAGVASGILLLTIRPLTRNQKWKAVILISIAIFFHYSSVVMLPLLFLSNGEMSKKARISWSLLIPIGYLFYIFNISINEIPIPYFQEKFEAYQELRDKGVIDTVHVFNLVFLVRIGIFYYLLYFYDTIRQFNPYTTIMLKMLALSLFCFPALAALPVLSFRISEIFGIVEVILFTNIYYTIKPSWLGSIIVCIIGTSLFMINVFYTKLLNI